ncbi:hypothetical protein EJB05_53153, partial [Eragrostis curvula]
MSVSLAESNGTGPLLPDDLLVDVLRRLTPRSLAVSRCVSKDWSRVVDNHRLLRTDLLPLTLGGIFFNYQFLYYFTQFLSRPTTGTIVSGRLNYTLPGKKFTDMDLLYVRDHCNGLLLLHHCVVNPATRQWTILPPSPPLRQLPPQDLGYGGFRYEYLVFDPTLSPNYEVLTVPNIPFNLSGCEEFEWPPSTWILPVFSSKTGWWEQRTFSRDGVTAMSLPGIVGSVQLKWHQRAYWREALYLCCSGNFIMRISLSNNTYRVIRLLTEDGEPTEHPRELHLGKSVKGIYCASLFQGSQLQVWFLNNQTEWVLKNDRDISHVLPNLNEYDMQRHGPWILQKYYYWEDITQHSDEDSAEDNKAIVEENFKWDSDNDNVLEPGSRSMGFHAVFLGFHPFKEVVFLSDKFERVLAYNWSTSKFQDLGKLFPKFYLDRQDGYYHQRGVNDCYPYTPCWVSEFPENLSLEAQLED